jgi:hypothetical protein
MVAEIAKKLGFEFVFEKETCVKVSNFDKDNFGKVYINETHYFDNVPEIAWNFLYRRLSTSVKMAKRPKRKHFKF